MARLSEQLIDQIKQNVSLLRLAKSQGHSVAKQGKDYVVSCPFHEEQTPSCVISPQTNLFNCFGCGVGGSLIDWVMKTQNVSFRFACEILQKDLGLVTENPLQPVKQNTPKKPTPSLAANIDNQTALRDVVNYYHNTLKQSPEVQEYLRSRGLDNAELIDRFKLGFANRTLGYHLPEKNRKAGAQLRGKLQEIGILRESGHEHFNGSLVVPVIDEQGVISEVYGRKILGQRLRKGTAQHLYLPGAHEGVWNIDAFKSCNEMILCEALIDAMTFWVHGFKNVTASYGTSGFTPSHLAAFKQYEIKRVLIAYDRDEAGNKAAEAVAKKLMAEGMECYRINLPQGMDVNEYALQGRSSVVRGQESEATAMQVTPPVKNLGLVIRQAHWMGKGQPPATPAPALPESTQASPLPELPAITLDAQVSEHEIKITLGTRLYRVRGLHKNMSYEQMKINLLVMATDKGRTAMHVDQVELYNAKSRAHFIKQAGIELGVKDEIIKTDLGKVLLKLETLQDENIKHTLEKQTQKTVELTDEEQSAALEYLRDPSLLSRLLLDFETCGVVGEQTNKLVGYLACVSRKLDKPLAIIIQSTSAAGKSSLMDAVLNMMPEEERIQYSAMTGQSLFYMGETNLKNKILAIAEEEGAEHASYALKLLQSEGEVSIASTGKNETTGNLETKSYTVEGPVMLFLTTTAIDIDEELLNRCVVLTVNETREQTEAIHALQRTSQTLEGLLQSESKKQLVSLHRNAQRLLRPLNVVNPYAEQLTFLSDKTRTRRDHMKYLQLINSVTLLHQYQREVKAITVNEDRINYIEVMPCDIEIANKLAHDVLGRSLDELPPQTRKLLQLISAMVKIYCEKENIEQKNYRFSRKGIRAYSGWSDNQLKVHCHRLEELEYLLVHRGSRGNSMVYELLFDGDSVGDKKQMMGLLDAQSLKNHTYDEQKLEQINKKSGPSCPQVGLALGQGCADEKHKNAINTDSNEFYVEATEKNVIEEKNTHHGASHRSRSALSSESSQPLAAHGAN